MTATCAQCGQPCDRRVTRCRACYMADHAITPATSRDMLASKRTKRLRLEQLARLAIEAGLATE